MALNINDLHTKRINTPIIPVCVVRRIKKGGPGVVRVELVQTTDIGPCIGKAFLGGVENNAYRKILEDQCTTFIGCHTGNKSSTATDLHTLPIVCLC
jgi:hypothetical protein